MLINQIGNHDSKFKMNSLVKFKDLINFKSSGFNFTSPIFLGAAGGGLLLIIILIIVCCCCCNKKTPELLENKNEDETKKEIEGNELGNLEFPEKGVKQNKTFRI